MKCCNTLRHSHSQQADEHAVTGRCTAAYGGERRGGGRGFGGERREGGLTSAVNAVKVVVVMVVVLAATS